MDQGDSRERGMSNNEGPRPTEIKRCHSAITGQQQRDNLESTVVSQLPHVYAQPGQWF